MKTRKRKYTTTILATALLFSLGGCVKDELHDTPHPDKGIVAVSIDLPQGASGEDYTVEIDGTTADGKEGRYTVSDPLPPGEYTVLAYNTPQGFTVTDGIARVERTDGTVRALTDFINPLPDYLYSGTERITVMADDTLRMNLDVTQRVRDLHIELTVTEGDPERITGITGTLSGVAEAYDLRNETLYGEAVSTRPTFTRDGDKVSADLRLLGDGSIVRIRRRGHDTDICHRRRSADTVGSGILRHHYRLGSGGRRKDRRELKELNLIYKQKVF